MTDYPKVIYAPRPFEYYEDISEAMDDAEDGCGSDEITAAVYELKEIARFRRSVVKEPISTASQEY